MAISSKLLSGQTGKPQLAWNLVGNTIKKELSKSLVQVRRTVNEAYDTGNQELRKIMSHIIHRFLNTFFEEEIESLDEDEVEATIYTLTYSLAEERQPVYSISTDTSYITINDCWVEVLSSYNDDFVEWALTELVMYIRQFNKSGHSQLLKEIQFLNKDYLKVNDKPEPSLSSHALKQEDPLARIRTACIMAQKEIQMDAGLENLLSELQRTVDVGTNPTRLDQVALQVLSNFTAEDKDKLFAAALAYLLEFRNLSAKQIDRELRKERILQMFAE